MSAVGIGDLIPFWHKKCSVSFFDEETLTLCACYFFLSKKLWASAISKYLQFSIYILNENVVGTRLATNNEIQT